MYQIKKDIYWVGALNPAMRIFDIIMKTEYGTSYNSYLIKGSNKVALIDACHERFFSTFINNIKQIIDPKKIDYLVVNHCEPDHTGALAGLIELNPNIQIYCTQTSSVFLKNITKKNLNIKIVSDNEELSLGNKTLKFVIAPFLHWPDSMFAYLKEDKTVFTCDFLGSHYCEPDLFDSEIKYPEKYQEAFKYYYDCIFKPFSKFVIQGLNKLNKLDVKCVCPSHGPILNKSIKKAKDLYLKWSNEKHDDKIVPIFYVTSYGYTKKIADQVYSELKKLGFKPELINLNEVCFAEALEKLNNAKFIALGSPTINRAALPPITNLITSIDAINARGKKVLIFGSYGWSGEAFEQIKTICEKYGLAVNKDYIKVNFNVAKQDLDKAKEVVREFVK